MVVGPEFRGATVALYHPELLTGREKFARSVCPPRAGRGRVSLGRGGVRVPCANRSARSVSTCSWASGAEAMAACSEHTGGASPDSGAHAAASVTARLVQWRPLPLDTCNSLSSVARRSTTMLPLRHVSQSACVTASGFTRPSVRASRGSRTRGASPASSGSQRRPAVGDRRVLAGASRD